MTSFPLKIVTPDGLIQTAIENALDPYCYLTWLMETAKDADLSQEKAIQALLPWNAPKECKAK